MTGRVNAIATPAATNAAPIHVVLVIGVSSSSRTTIAVPVVEMGQGSVKLNRSSRRQPSKR
jgi:hypothetical protein